jgi:uncharacterized lipoprotein YbaY
VRSEKGNEMTAADAPQVIMARDVHSRPRMVPFAFTMSYSLTQIVHPSADLSTTALRIGFPE